MRMISVSCRTVPSQEIRISAFLDVLGPFVDDGPAPVRLRERVHEAQQGPAAVKDLSLAGGCLARCVPEAYGAGTTALACLSLDA